MNTKTNNYPDLFFERFLREPTQPRHSVVSMLGVRSMRVTNEAFKALLDKWLKVAGVLSVEETIDMEFSFLDFQHTPHEALCQQQSIFGKGGFTITLRAGTVFVSAVYAPCHVGETECYRIADAWKHGNYNAFTTEGIVTSDINSVHCVLKDHLFTLVRKAKDVRDISEYCRQELEKANK